MSFGWQKIAVTRFARGRTRLCKTSPIHEFGRSALRSLAPELMIKGSLKLLESSYETGDHAAIEQALFVPSDVDELHTIVFDLASVCAKVMQSECLGLLLFVYEYSPCGNCRQIAVETLEHLGITPSWLKEERPYDAMEKHPREVRRAQT